MASSNTQRGEVRFQRQPGVPRACNLQTGHAAPEVADVDSDKSFAGPTPKGASGPVCETEQ